MNGCSGRHRMLRDDVLVYPFFGAEACETSVKRTTDCSFRVLLFSMPWKLFQMISELTKIAEGGSRAVDRGAWNALVLMYFSLMAPAIFLADKGALAARERA